MTTLINGAQTLEQFTAALPDVDGSTMRDLGRVRFGAPMAGLAYQFMLVRTA
jgi:hypothetical protein